MNYLEGKVGMKVEFAPATDYAAAVEARASRCVNSSGFIGGCVAPSRHGVLSFSST